MKIKILCFIFIVAANYLYSQDIYQNYITAYGEGPVGQYIIGFITKFYTKEDAVNCAKNEIIEFLSGMIYGYTFTYKVENKNNNSNGYFELLPISHIKNTDKNIQLNQYQEKSDELKIQALYKLNSGQKSYLAGFQSSTANMSMGEATLSSIASWEKRIETYNLAIKNAVLNKAKEKYKSRPYILKGKILLKENPVFSIISGDWRAIVKIHINIDYANFDSVY
jgi:hypothetical protein